LTMAENIRAKAEELRTRVRTRIEEIRGGGSSPGHSPLLGNLVFGGSSPELLPKGSLISDIREKGLLATVRARIEEFRGGKPAEEEKPRPEIAGPERPEAGVGYMAAREYEKWKGTEILTPGKVQRGRIAVEGS